MQAPARRLPMLLAVAAALAGLLVRGQVRTHVTELERYEDLYYLPPAEWLPVFALGHDAALCDLLWIRGLIYMGDEYVHRGALQHVFGYIDAMLALDSDFEALYHWTATVGLYRPEAVTRADVLRTVEILERGVERMPESGQLHWDLGATYAFEARPYAQSDAERDDWRIRGTEHLMAAARLGAAPPWMMLSNAAMLLRVGASERAVEHLEEMYASIDDPEVRAEIAARIASIRGETYSAAFVDEAESSETARIGEFPYAHPHLYFLMGPRPPVDIDSTLRDGFAAHAFDGEIVLEEE